MRVKNGTDEKPFCVYKKGQDGNPEGDSLGCHASKGEADAQIAAIYANEGKKSKGISNYGAGVILSDVQDNDPLRWVALTSSAFQDKDGHIVTMEAQGKDTYRMMKTKQFGPVRWWHMGFPVVYGVDWERSEPGWGIDLGTTDLSVMHGRIRIESGKYSNPIIAKSFNSGGMDLGASIQFSHPAHEPISGKYFHNIKTLERSWLLRPYASNRVVDVLTLQQKGEPMPDSALDILYKMLGMNRTDQILSKSADLEKEAEDKGLESKGQQPASDPIVLTSKESDMPTVSSVVADEIRYHLVCILGDALRPIVAEEVNKSMTGLFAQYVSKGQEDVAESMKQLAGLLDALAKGQSVDEAKTAILSIKGSMDQLDTHVREIIGLKPSGAATPFVASKSASTKIGKIKEDGSVEMDEGKQDLAPATSQPQDDSFLEKFIMSGLDQ